MAACMDRSTYSDRYEQTVAAGGTTVVIFQGLTGPEPTVITSHAYQGEGHDTGAIVPRLVVPPCGYQEPPPAKVIEQTPEEDKDA